MTYSPTVRGRRLARDLKRLRLASGLTGEQVVTQLGWDTAKLSRMENAKMRTTSGEVMELLEVYGVTGEARAQLVQLARDARQKGWWHPYGDVLKVGFSDYLAFESEAVTYCGHQTQLIPGLFQTPEYARLVLQGSRPRTPDEVEQGVKVRVDRQQRLTASSGRLHVWQIVEESALRRVVGDADTMRAQLGHLLTLADLPNVSLQVLPYRAGIHAAIDGPFILLTFDGYPNVLYIEHLMGCLYMERPDETTQGSLVFGHVRTAALNAGDSAALIEQVVTEFS